MEEQALRTKFRETKIISGDAIIQYSHAQYKIQAKRNSISSIYLEGGIKLIDPEHEFQYSLTSWDLQLRQCHAPI